MIWIDYAILAIIGLSVLISIWRGFTKEALSLAGWIIAFIVAMKFVDNLDVLLEPHIQVLPCFLPASLIIWRCR